MTDRFMLRKEVMRITGKSYPTLWRWYRAGLFPKPHKIGPNSIAWLESEVLAWVESHIDSKSA